MSKKIIKPQESGIRVTINLDDFKKVLKNNSYIEIASDAVVNLIRMMDEAQKMIKKKS